MAVAVQGFQAYFGVLILVLNIIGYGEDRRDLCTALGGDIHVSNVRPDALPSQGIHHIEHVAGRGAVSGNVTQQDEGVKNKSVPIFSGLFR